jgi:hypothetical protein
VAATKTLKATRTLKANAAKASAADPYSQPFLTLEEEARITRAFSFVFGAGGNFISFRPLHHPMNTTKRPKGYKVTTGTLVTGTPVKRQKRQICGMKTLCYVVKLLV